MCEFAFSLFVVLCLFNRGEVLQRYEDELKDDFWNKRL